MRGSNNYRFVGNVAYGTLSTGEEFIVDADIAKLLDGKYICAKENGGTVIARRRSDKKVFSLARIVLGLDGNDKRKAQRLDNTIFDYRKENLWVGNKYIDCDDYYTVVCKNQKTFLIDLEDYELVSQYVWHVDVNNYVVSDRNDDKKPIKLHRLLMGILDKPEAEVDHIYHDTCDNRKKNMRVVGRSENVHNIRRNQKSPYGCPGVELVRGYDNLWKAGINYKCKRIYLGCFHSKEEAIQARLDAEKRLGVLRVE